MFALMDLAFVAITATTTMSLSPFEDVEHPQHLEEVVYVNTHTGFLLEHGDCTFTGLLVPYARDWNVKRGDWLNERVVREAEPDKMAGIALVVNKRFCPGEKSPEPIFFAGSYPRTGGKFWRDASMQTINITQTPEENHPQWLPQVLDRIQRLAETDESARDFYAYMLHLDGKASQEVAAPVVDAQVVAMKQNVVANKPATE